ncbi:MAG: hypothetical protein J5449_02670 [Oscillospiraceae bacterium]|nr:hypothetical protein [Oscillospiraceae bacterium]
MGFDGERADYRAPGVPEGRYWGELTESRRSRGGETGEPVPDELLRAFGLLKKASARANFTLAPERMGEEKCAAIFAAADELIRGKHGEDFPLSVWSAPSDTNDNVNEVIANRGSEMADMPNLVQPDELDLSREPESAFPTAARIAAALAVAEGVLPVAEAEMEESCAALRGALSELYLLPPGAAADAPEGFDAYVVREIARQTGKPFVIGSSAPAEAGAAVCAHQAIMTLARELERSSPENEVRERASEALERLSEAEKAIGAAAESCSAERDGRCLLYVLSSALLLGSLLGGAA